MGTLTHAERGKLGGSKYTEPETERGLQAMAILGNAAQASRETGIPAETLNLWRRSQHAKRYQQIRKDIVPQVHAIMATETEDLVQKYMEIEHIAADRLKMALPDLRPTDVAGVVANISKARAISQDKALLLRNKPTVIEQRQDVGEILTALSRLGVRVQAPVVDSTAIEIGKEQASPLDAALA